MAIVKIVMPQMGESITTGTITKWTKKVGDVIELDENLLEISTDKVESEIPSPVKGRVEKLHFKEGDTVDVGVLIAEIQDDLAAAATTSSAPAPAAKASAPVAAPVAEKAQAPAAAATEESGERRFYTPLVKKLAEEAGLSLAELAKVTGTGAAGRVNKQDLDNYLAQRKTGATTTIASVSAPAPSAPAPKAAVQSSGRTEVIPMDNMRKAIARNMVQSKLTSPHVNSISEVDLTHLVKFRDSFKDEFFKQEGFKLTFTPFIMRAIVMALKEHPYVNASIDGDNIIVKKDINLGCAVAVPGNGLVVPNIQSADTLNMLGLCRAINTLANKARTKKLTLDDLQGGTFTFTNVGSFGTLLATPVILQPQVGIYASGVITKRPVVVEGDAIAVRSMMYGTHTYDHRLVDGELGGKFLESVHQNLREMKPEQLF